MYIKTDIASPLEFAMRVIVPHLFDGIRRSRLHGTDPTPVEARKQRFELCVAQCH
jgi:hypothetical protein